MRCDAFRDAMFDYRDGHLDAWSLDEFRAHFASCAACSETLRWVEGQEALLGAVPRPKAPAGLWTKVQSEIGDRRSLRSLASLPRRMRWGASIAAAALLAVSATLALLRGPAPVKAPPRGLDIIVIEVQDGARAGALGQLAGGPAATDPTAALDLMFRDR
jgi:hypothetical protein